MSTKEAEAPPVEAGKPSAEQIIAKLLENSYPREWVEYVKGMNLMQRLHGAMSDIGAMKKDKLMDGGKQKFNYHGHAAITAACKAAFEKWRIAISSSVISETHENITIGQYNTPGYFTTAMVRVRFTNIDNPDDFSESDHMGYGQDTADKGIGKAVTYAVKYALMKILMISDGEEPDNEAFNWEDEETHGKPKPGAKSESRQEAAQRKLREAEGQAGVKPPTQNKVPSQMNNNELYALIVTELSPLGATGDMLKAYLKEHDQASKLSEVQKERMLAILREAKALRGPFDTAFNLCQRSSDPGAALTELNELIGGRNVFMIEPSEIKRFADRLLEMERAA